MASSSATPSAVAIEVDRFCEARVEELKALRSTVISGRRNKRRAHQNLSWHLRRRTLSYSARRAPASVRAAIVRELASNGAQPPKSLNSRRFRKYRSRARFLASMRTLRCSHPDRLETHLWHAKRYHMTRTLGQDQTRVIPDFCNDRGVRSAFKAFSHSSIAHDASYYDVISIAAINRAAAVDGIRSILRTHDADRVACEPIISGRRCVRGLVAIDSENAFAIAPIDLLFRPLSSSEPSNDVSGMSTFCFLWVHPAASKAVSAALSLESDESEVKVDILRNDLQTFRIYGPRAGFVLGAVIERTGDYIESDWDLVRHARSPATAPACCVLSGEMLDPRRNFPPKRVQSMATAKNTATELHSLANLSLHAFSSVPNSDSRIWMREAPLPAGSGEPKVDGNDPNVVQRIPFIMMQRPGEGRRGLGSGWDIILPKGWGKSFWRALMYANGARAMGITEMKHVTLETDERIFPRDFPDSVQAQLALRAVEKTREEWYKRRPKSKRVNYALYKVQSPFFPDLAAILQNDGKQDEKKDKENESLNNNYEEMTPVDKTQQVGATKKVKRKAQKRRRVMVPNESKPETDGVTFQVLRNRALIEVAMQKEDCEWKDKFVRVIIRPKGRGTLKDNGLVCMPIEKDEGTEPREDLKDKNPRGKRSIIGRITSGAFSMAEGGPRAVGFMRLDAFEKVFFQAPGTPARGSRGRNGRLKRELSVLVRNCDSPHYRWATASITG